MQKKKKKETFKKKLLKKCKNECNFLTFRHKIILDKLTSVKINQIKCTLKK